MTLAPSDPVRDTTLPSTPVSTGSSVSEVQDAFPLSQSLYTYYPSEASNIRSRDLIVLVGKSLFRINVAPLQADSGYLKGLLQLPEPVTALAQGTEENPLPLPDIGEAEFNAFLTWVQLKVMPSTESGLVGMMHISHLWDYPPGIKLASQALESMDPPMTPYMKLFYAQRFDVSRWVRPALEEILLTHEEGRKIRRITNSEAETMGARAYRVIAKTFETMQVHRSLLAFDVPVLKQSAHCDGPHTRCQKDWTITWFHYVAPALLHPTNPIPLIDLPSFVRKLSFPIMDITCRLQACRELEADDRIQAEVRLCATASEVLEKEWFGEPMVESV